MQCLCGGMVFTPGDATGCRRRRKPNAMTICFVPPLNYGVWESWKESTMKAYLLEEPNRSFAADDLSKFGVFHRRLPVAGADAEIARIKGDRGYVEQDEVALSKET